MEKEGRGGGEHEMEGGRRREEYLPVESNDHRAIHPYVRRDPMMMRLILQS